ncbi:MAG: hypothetical protein Q4B54_07685 [Coriobacteriales bacterium]|nr:hypothetical protein [Coriobacteriales bacterium]
MNNIGINDNLNRDRIRKLLIIGLFGCLLTGAGDFLLGYGVPAQVDGFWEQIVATAPNLSDAQLIAGGLLGFIGLFIEGLSFFAVYRLMADAAPHYAHIYRAGIFGYLWLAPVGCHLNVAVFNLAFKYCWQVRPQAGNHLFELLYPWFGIPAYLLLIVFWVPMLVVQWKAFARGLTPYPERAKWFNLVVGALPALALAALLGPDTPLGGGIATMFLSFGNAWTFGGLLATLPSEERFAEFRASLAQRQRTLVCR